MCAGTARAEYVQHCVASQYIASHCLASHHLTSELSRCQTAQCKQQLLSPLYLPRRINPSDATPATISSVTNEGSIPGTRLDAGVTCDRDRVLRQRGIPIDCAPCEEQLIPRFGGGRACSGRWLTCMLRDECGMDVCCCRSGTTKCEDGE